MPRILAETDTSQTIETDDGQIVVVPRGQFLAEPGPGPGPGFTAGPPPIPPPQQAMEILPTGPMPADFGLDAGSPAINDMQQTVGPMFGGAGPQGAPAPSPVDDARGVLEQLNPPPAPAPAPAAQAQPQGNAFQQADAAAQGAFGEAEAAGQQEAAVNAQIADQQHAARAQAGARADAIQVAADEQRALDQQKRQALEVKATAAVDEWASHKVDENRYYASQSTGKQIAAAISIALSGIGEAIQGRGGQNPALQIIEKYAAADIEAQLRERDKLGSVAQQRQGQADRFSKLATDRQGEFSLRMASELERGARAIELAASKYGSELAQVNGVKAAADLRGRKAEYLTKYADGEFNRGMETRKLNEQVAARKASTALGWANHKQSGEQFDARLANDKDEFNRGMDLKAQEQAAEAAKLDAAGKTKEAEALRAQAKEERELAIGGGSLLAGGKGVADDVGRLLNKDGSLFKAPDLVSAQKLRMQVGATVTAANLLDEMVRLRNAKGWSSDLLKSDEWRAMKSNMGAVILEAKNAGELGALSGPDMELVQSILGTTDATEVRDPTAGLMQARKNMVLKTKNSLRVANYTGDFEVPDRSKEEAAPRDTDLESLVSRGKPSIADGAAGITIVNGRPRVTPRDKMTDEQRTTVQNADEGLTRDQQLGRDKLIERVRAGDVQAAEALSKAAQTAPNPQARNAAAAALTFLYAEGNPIARDLLDRTRKEFPIMSRGGDR